MFELSVGLRKWRTEGVEREREGERAKVWEAGVCWGKDWIGVRKRESLSEREVERGRSHNRLHGEEAKVQMQQRYETGKVHFWLILFQNCFIHRPCAWRASVEGTQCVAKTGCKNQHSMPRSIFISVQKNKFLSTYISYKALMFDHNTKGPVPVLYEHGWSDCKWTALSTGVTVSDVSDRIIQSTSRPCLHLALICILGDQVTNGQP